MRVDFVLQRIQRKSLTPFFPKSFARRSPEKRAVVFGDNGQTEGKVAKS